MRTVTVGPDSGDFTGTTNASIQLAIDSLSGTGGVVEILPGEYACIDGLYMRSGVRVVGHSEKTILRKSPGVCSPLAVDADYGQLKLTPADASGFVAGMGVSVSDNTGGGWATSTAQVTAVEDGVLRIDTHLKKDYAVPNEVVVSNACALVKGYRCVNASIENLVIEGEKDSNHRMDGCRGGAVYWYKSEACAVIDCDVRNFNGDGISFQITRGIRVEGCRATGGTNIGLHPGTGSAKVHARNCRFDHNDAGGFFLCWRVQESVFEDLECDNNAGFGISIGHKDTDNVFRRCHLHDNGVDGLVFREERDLNGAHRNQWENCVIEANGEVGVRVHGVTRENRFRSCSIRPGGDGLQPTAVLMDEGAEDIDFEDCVVEGDVVK